MLNLFTGHVPLPIPTCKPLRQTWPIKWTWLAPATSRAKNDFTEFISLIFSATRWRWEPLRASAISTSCRVWLMAGKDWGSPNSFKSITSCRSEALTAILIVSDCSSGSVCIRKWRSSLFPRGTLAQWELWRSSMMSMTSCFSARSSLRAWGVYDQNCCALKSSTITPTVTPNSPNALPGLSIRQIPAVYYRSPLSFTVNAFHGGRENFLYSAH